MKDFLEGLASLLNVRAEDVAELFVTEGEETKLKEDIKPLNVVKGWVKTRVNDTYKAGHRKGAEAIESVIKQKGFDSDLQGVELLNAYLETLKVEPSNGNQNASEWEKKYNDLLPKVEAFDSQIAELKANHANELKQKDIAVVKSRLRSDVRSSLGKMWAGDDEHLEIVLNNFPVDQIRYEGNQPVLLNASGEVLVDDLHRPIGFDDRVKKLGGLIGGFHQVDPNKGGPPPPSGQGGSGQKYTLPSGITQREYNALYDQEKDPVKRKQMAEARIAQLEGK